MFTGIVEAIGRVVSVKPRSGSSRLTVDGPWPEHELRTGDSVSVDGVCLTLARIGGERFEADVIAETLSRTTLGRLRPGAAVNLERALRLGDRLGGHLVQGHVDGVARVVERVRRADDWRLRVGLGPELAPFVAFKGSIALQGVSLTVAAVAADRFEVALIPETIARTTLGEARAGARLNVEVDLLARYLDRLGAAGRFGPHGGPRRDGDE